MSKIPVGFNAYGVKFELGKDPRRLFETLAGYGFTCYEPMVNVCNDSYSNPKYPNMLWQVSELEQYVPLLKSLGMDIPSAHIIIFDDDTDEMIRKINIMHDVYNIRYFVYANAQLHTQKEAERTCHILNTICEGISEDAVVCYHCHENELQNDVCGMPIFDYLMENCPKVKIEYDQGWIVYAGADPDRFIEKYRNRIVILHFKDLVENYVEVGRRNCSAAVGEGIIDYRSMLKNMECFLNLDKRIPVIIDQDSSKTDIIADLKTGIDYINNNI